MARAGSVDGNGSRRMKALTVLAIALFAASCSSGPLRSSQFGFGSQSFEETVETHPELGAVSEAFDRIVDPTPSDDERERQLDLFAEVFGVTFNDYVVPVTAAQMAELAVDGLNSVSGEAKLAALASGNVVDAPQDKIALDAESLMAASLSHMMSTLDPHSGYLAPDDYREMKLRTRGEFGGIGIEVTMEEGLVKVVSPIDDTPGQRAGLLAGDLITEVDGQPIYGLTLSEAVRLMRGRAGSTVVLTVRRGDVEEDFQVSIVRDVVRIRAVRARAEGNVAYIRVTTFNERAEEGLRRAVRDLRDEIGDQMVGVVLDLRNNPGGLLDQALGVSDAFLSGGEIVSTRTRDDGVVRRYSAVRGDIANGLPIIVLINGGSASAAEIVSGALQDHDRATVMGTRSFGKGSVQTIMPVSGGGAVRLTTARYYTPSGRSIQLTGIIPDILADIEEEGRTREADLDHALAAEDVVDTQGAKHMADLCPDLAENEEDQMLACAIDLIEARQTVASSPGE